MSEPIVLDLVPSNISVTLRDQDGKETDYTLREMVAQDRDDFLNLFKKRFETDEKGELKNIRDYKNHQAELITLCLFDASNKKVPMPTIQAWPSHVVHQLYAAAQKLNAIQTVEEKEKTEADPLEASKKE